MSHLPQRTCIACKKIDIKSNLVRISAYDGQYNIDLTQTHNGRGCYVCSNAVCIAKAIKSRAVNRSLKCQIPNSLYDNLREVQLEN